MSIRDRLRNELVTPSVCFSEQLRQLTDLVVQWACAIVENDFDPLLWL